MGLIPGFGKSPGGGHSNPLQYSCLENSMDRGAQCLQSIGHKESQMTEAIELNPFCPHYSSFVKQMVNELQFLFFKYIDILLQIYVQQKLTVKIQPRSILKEISPGCSLEGLMLKLKLQYFGHLMRRVDSLEKTDAGKDWGQEEKGTTEDEMAGWHH